MTMGSLIAVDDTPVSTGASDVELIGGVMAGDEGAMAELYRRHAHAVGVVIGRVVVDRTLRQDVMQDVFVSLWRRPGRFDADRGTLRNYLMTIARGRALDIVRAEHARGLREARRLQDVRLERGAFPDVEDAALREVGVSDLLKAVRSLPAKNRSAVLLAFYGGRTYCEVARDLGLPVGTVKSQIRSGLRQLAATLSGGALLSTTLALGSYRR
jgi:RNA polymerase sigma-70 factor (ECF subfamily)